MSYEEDPSDMTKMLGWRRRLFSLGLGIGVFLFLRQIWLSCQALRDQDSANLVMYFVQMVAWLMVMRYLGVSMSLRRTLQGYSLSFLPRYIPGSVWGYWSRSEWLQQSCSVSYGVSVMGSILEALGLVLTGLFLSGVYVTTQLQGGIQIGLGMACAILLMGTWLILPRVATLVGCRLMKKRGYKTYDMHRSSAAWSAVIILYLLLWTVFGSSLLLASRAIVPLPVSHLPSAVFASSLSWILGFVIVLVPAGLGLRELALSSLLTSHLGLLSWQADLVAVLSRFGLIVAELSWLLVGLVLMIRHKGE
jgi:hypothetical protein